MFWTENSLRKLIVEVISSQEGAASIKRHVAITLRQDSFGEDGAELKKAAEELAEKAKASLHRRINAIYAAQCERLDQQLIKFVATLGTRAPDQERRLDTLTKRLAEVEASADGWLDELKKQLESLSKRRQKIFSEELEKISKTSADRIKETLEKTELILSNLVDDRLHNLIIETVRHHVKSAPFEHDRLSNRQISAAKRISLREVKRQRARGLL